MVECSFTEEMVVCCRRVGVSQTSEFAPASNKEFRETTIECEFTLKCIREMVRTYSQLNHTDNYSQHSSII